MDNLPIYLDYNATTPVDEEVLTAMLPYFQVRFGNAASRSHRYGWEADEAVSQASDHISKLLSIETKEILFTSGATESVNLAMKGVFEKYYRKGKHIITTKTEHKAVLDTCQKLESQGGEVTYLDVDKDGFIDLKALEQAIKDTTILVSIMWANNETGVIQPMKEIGHLCDKYGVLLMSDATQAIGKVPVNPKEMGVHLMAFSGHKMYGPKGIGGLYVCQKNPRIKLTAQIDGGGHQKNMRSGTLNVPGIVGIGAAAKLALESLEHTYSKMYALRQRLEKGLLSIEESQVNGGRARLPNTVNVTFKYVEGEALINKIGKSIAVSTGSACTSSSLEPSHVLQNMGLSVHDAHSSIRFSLGKYNTEEEVDFVIEEITKGVKSLRSMSPYWELYKDGVDVDSLL